MHWRSKHSLFQHRKEGERCKAGNGSEAQKRKRKKIAKRRRREEEGCRKRGMVRERMWERRKTREIGRKVENSERERRK